MSWTRYTAILSKRADPYNFLVYVWGVTKETAYDKLRIEYPTSKYEIIGLDEASK